jgi:hypothetical protein
VRLWGKRVSFRADHHLISQADRSTQLADSTWSHSSAMTDSGRVRIDADAESDRATEAVDAQAHTVGTHIVFAAGRRLRGLDRQRWRELSRPALGKMVVASKPRCK